ncbi:MAG: branched-chain amino acid ABC transporter permease [Clostridium sp.]
MDFLKVVFNLVLASGILFLCIKFLSKFFDFSTDKIVGLDDKKKKILILGTCGVLLIFPIIAQSQAYVLRTSVVILLYVVLALSLNFVLGFAGQLSMGHAAFYAIGAYTVAILTVDLGMNFWLALIAAAVVAALFGFILGMPTLRLKGDYLAIVTIGFGEIVRLVLINWIDLTRGPSGIPSIPSPSIFSFKINTNIEYYYLILVLVFVTIYISYKLLYSRLGRGLIAVRDDEIAADAMGVNVTYLKVLAFVLGALLAGLAGGFFASFVHYVNPDNFTYMESVSILCMVVLGGLGSVPGVIIGAAILTLLPEALRDVATYRYAIYGILLALMMIMRPQGMISMSKLKRRAKL